MSKTMDYEKKICSLDIDSPFKILNAARRGPFPEIPLGLDEGRVLEVGCGAGYFLRRYVEKKPHLDFYAVDISKKAIKLAKEKLPKVKFINADAHKLPYPGNYFDGVISKQVLEHLERPERALEESYRVLKRGGRLYLETPVEVDQIIIPPPRLTDKYQGHIQHFSKNNILPMLKKAGFKVDNYYYSGFLYDQVLNYLCLILYAKLNLPSEFSVEQYIYSVKARKKWTISTTGLFLLKNAVLILGNLEKMIVPKFIPGSNIHIMARK